MAATRQVRPLQNTAPRPRALLAALIAIGYAALCAVPVAAQKQRHDPNMKTVGGAILNEKADGYRGIWYMNQPSNDEYKYKYSGGMGTYCCKHNPFAIYCSNVNKTFFCYGGATQNDSRKLLHMVSYYDHATGTVPRPTVLLDKKTSDAHDNPVMAIDGQGYIWIFSTAHGLARRSFISRSKRPYDVDEFQSVDARYGSQDPRPLDNFSYMQAAHDAERGFVCFFTHYHDPAQRTSFVMTSTDGARWSDWQRLAAIEFGHYQVTNVAAGKMATAMDFHPQNKGLNHRTNLYCLESTDWGRSWHAANGDELELPLTSVKNPALVHDYQSEGLLVYLKEVQFDADGRPIISYITSKGYASGPTNDPRTWRVAQWTGHEWDIRSITTSGNNYDYGSLYLEADGTWRLIAPTDAGPQAHNPGGEMVMWTSADRGATWRRARTLTAGSPRNHNFARRPVNAHPDFYAFWADGHARQPSESWLYFCTRDGDVYRLPRDMDGLTVKPERVVPANASASRTR